MHRGRSCWHLAPALAVLLTATLTQAADPYGEAVLRDEPVAWWRFEALQGQRAINSAGEGLIGAVQGNVRNDVAGPRPGEFPDFASANRAAMFPRGSNYIVVPDPGEQSLLDFDNGDALTLEAWVRWDGGLAGSFPYIVGKGRTHRPGKSHRNQNYALRLAPQSSGVHLSFLFCDAETEPDKKGGIGNDGHRWTSTASIPEDGAWHHVALTYEFGTPENIRGYIDGEATGGKWDMGGPTTKRPVVDNDELWIGSSMKGGATFGGEIDEVAIYRTALSPEQIRRHVKIDLSAASFVIGGEVEDVPTDHVRVEILEGLPRSRTWEMRFREPEPLFSTHYFAMKNVPHRYTDNGLIDDRPATSLLHLTSQIELPAGEYEFALRSIDAAKLFVDGKEVVSTPFMNLNGDAHQPYYDGLDRGPEILSLAEGHTEEWGKVTLEGSTHVVSLYRQFGNRNHGTYLGELIVAVRPVGGEFRILSPTEGLPFTDAGWLDFLDWEQAHLAEVNRERRTVRAASQQEYWQRRHDYARQHAGPEVAIPAGQAASPIDRFLLQKLNEASIQPTASIDDFDYLRRLSLDTTGVIPSESLIADYLAMPAQTRRSQIVEVLLDDPAWADHWVGYWQDVLAENPGLTKPELNNTGPFRWFLHEAFLDNKPFDRFVTELVMMQGSRFGGGPAGFGVATQNDVPMAAKAHVLGTAFLGVEMKCARCHDAPYHDVKQEDLFNLAAMLKRSAEKIPGTSSVIVDDERAAQMAVQVSLAPGSVVEPVWPFEQFVGRADTSAALPDDLLHHPQDTREQLAAFLTSPHNDRFAKALVNRMWKRYLGRGIVEPVDDWEHVEASHPELLAWLARELVTHDYDLKHIARLILTSDVYQRMVATGIEERELFAGPTRRRVTGEQLVDSLLAAAGKDFGCEELTMDRDARRPDTTFGHFGIPQRAWEFVAVSNERDRPSLNLPTAQSIIDILTSYGWRQQRQEPLTDRASGLTPLQPMVLANGTMANRIVDLSDGSQVAALCLEDQTVEDLVTRLFQRVLTRPPSDGEQSTFVALLQEGYDQRIVAGPEVVPPRRIYRSGITWSNHFDPKSDDEAIRRQREILQGDPPTRRLDAEWRGRVEDMLWALMNSPEFVFVP
jgi:hypothetical protein